ncbi:hypothetical protein TNCV_3827501 [Trichonephila clavipes]|nr:hypothetical protein TNCV_3827501 [Trichonephila clavipes]
MIQEWRTFDPGPPPPEKFLCAPLVHKCDVDSLFPLFAEKGARQTWENADISLIEEKEFRNWVVKDLDPPSQAVPTVKKRPRNIVLSFSHDSGTTARLKTYNVHLDIGAQRARDQMSRDRQGDLRTKEKEELGGERREVYKESERERGRRQDFEGAVVRPLQRGGKTIVRPRSMADSELGRSGNGRSPDQR